MGVQNDKPKCLGWSDPPMRCPEGCTNWYDGCNDCSCAGVGELGACTKRACVTKADEKCLNWEKTEDSAYCDEDERCCPEGSTCMIPRGGEKKMCLDRGDGPVEAVECRITQDDCDGKTKCCPSGTTCMVPRGGRAKACVAGNDMVEDAVDCGAELTCPADCNVWYDGCNTCRCAEGKTIGCTRRFCTAKGKAY